MEPSAQQRLTARARTRRAPCQPLSAIGEHHAAASPATAPASRARRWLCEYGGCLIADEEGGKTFVSLAVTAPYEHRPSIVVPSSFALSQSQLHAPTAGNRLTHDLLELRWRAGRASRSTSSMSTNASLQDTGHPAVKATVRTRDNAPLSRMPRPRRCRIASVTSGPVHLGDAADQLPLDQRFAWCAAMTRTTTCCSASRLLEALLGDHDDAVLDAVLAFPTPTATRDGGDGRVLRTIALVRAGVEPSGASRPQCDVGSAWRRRSSRTGHACFRRVPKLAPCQSVMPCSSAWPRCRTSIEAPTGLDERLVRSGAGFRFSGCEGTTPDPDVARVAARRLRRPCRTRDPAFAERPPAPSPPVRLHARRQRWRWNAELAQSAHRIRPHLVDELLQRACTVCTAGTRRLHEQVTLPSTTTSCPRITPQDASAGGT